MNQNLDFKCALYKIQRYAGQYKEFMSTKNTGKFIQLSKYY